jgi:hypothetical protein
MPTKDEFLASLKPLTCTICRNAEHSPTELARCEHVFGAACAICLETYNAEHFPTELPGCGHVFGAACVTTLVNSELASHDRCPICRKQLYVRGQTIPHRLSVERSRGDGMTLVPRWGILEADMAEMIIESPLVTSYVDRHIARENDVDHGVQVVPNTLDGTDVEVSAEPEGFHHPDAQAHPAPEERGMLHEIEQGRKDDA